MANTDKTFFAFHKYLIFPLQILQELLQYIRGINRSVSHQVPLGSAVFQCSIIYSNGDIIITSLQDTTDTGINPDQTINKITDISLSYL